MICDDLPLHIIISITVAEKIVWLHCFSFPFFVVVVVEVFCISIVFKHTSNWELAH